MHDYQITFIVATTNPKIAISFIRHKILNLNWLVSADIFYSSYHNNFRGLKDLWHSTNAP